MVIQHRFLLLIYTLCYVVIIHGYLLGINDAETCNLLCGQCNASGVFADGLCECSFTDNNNEECVQRIQKEIQAIDLNIVSDDSTDEERNVRSILRRRRLRFGDADKVAQYFINGGPAAGHSHFIRVFSEAHDSADSAKNSFSGAVDESSPENGFHSASLIHSISRSTCDSPLYLVPGNADNQNVNQNDVENVYAPNVEAASPAVYPSGGLCDLTSSLLGAISPQRTHRHGLHHVLLKTATLPAHALHNLLMPHHHHHHHPIYHHSIFRSAHPQTIPYGHQYGRCENNDGSDSSVSSIAISTNKPIDHNVAASVPISADQMQYSPQILYTYDTNVAQPAINQQYQPFNYPYRYMYQNPVFKILYPENYYAQPYIYQGTGPIISASNPYHYCINNANTEQPSTVQPIGDSVYFNNETEKPKDTITDNVSKKEKKIEKDGNTKL